MQNILLVYSDKTLQEDPWNCREFLDREKVSKRYENCSCSCCCSYCCYKILENFLRLCQYTIDRNWTSHRHDLWPYYISIYHLGLQWSYLCSICTDTETLILYPAVSRSLNRDYVHFYNHQLLISLLDAFIMFKILTSESAYKINVSGGGDPVGIMHSYTGLYVHLVLYVQHCDCRCGKLH